MTETNQVQREILRISGADKESFLQGLVTNDVKRLKDGLVYAALLTPQGKYLADFFMVPDEAAILIDLDARSSAAVRKRLTMYKLRADVQIETSALQVIRGIGETPEIPGAMVFADPRDPALGWRAYGTDLPNEAEQDWTALRVAHSIPEFESELIPEDSYLLEYGFERLNGVDFAKGCYVGQEIVARMKHKSTLRKGLVQVKIEGSAEIGTEITAEGKPVGRMGSQSGNAALAHVRFDRSEGEMQAGSAKLWLKDGAPLPS